MARRLQAYRDHALSPHRYAQMKLHIAACLDCSEQIEQASAAENLLEGIRPATVALSALESDRLFARVLSEIHPQTPRYKGLRMRQYLVGGLSVTAVLIVLILSGLGVFINRPRSILAKGPLPQKHRLRISSPLRDPIQRLTAALQSRQMAKEAGKASQGRTLFSPLGHIRPAEYSTVNFALKTLTVEPELVIDRIANVPVIEVTTDPTSIVGLENAVAPPSLVVIVQRMEDSGVLANVVQVTATSTNVDLPGFVRTATCNSTGNGMPSWTACTLTDTQSETIDETETITILDKAGSLAHLRVASTCARANELERQFP